MLDFRAAQNLHRDITRMYSGGDRESARLRGMHLAEVTRLTPHTMAANVLSAALVVWTFRSHPPAGLLVWMLALLTVVGFALWAWSRRRGRTVETATPRALNRATWHAAVLGAVWAMVPLLWFAEATMNQRMLVATLVTGMLGAGSFVLSPLPVASLVWTGILWVASLGALWSTGDPALAAVAVLVSAYAPIVALGSMSAWRKATALILAQAHAARQEQVLAVLLDDFEQQAGEALWETGADGYLKHVSARLAELLRVGPAALVAQPFLQIMEAGDPRNGAALRLAFDSGRPFANVPITVSDGGHVAHLTIKGKNVLDEAGHPAGWRGVIADVTVQVNDEQRLWELAHTDTLTGLANRLTLRETLAHGLSTGQAVTLVLLDLDHFKSVNDTHGHSAGDEVLQSVARSLKAVVRSGDLVARLGGDEFAVLRLGAAGADGAADLAARLVNRLLKPLESQGRLLSVGASAGVAVCDGPGGVESLGVEQLMVHADVALYAAKEAGRGRYAVYVPEMGERSLRRSAIEQGLHQAIERDELELHWQPKVQIESWTIVGAEALLRWSHPTLGRVGPAEFVAVAEQGGLIDMLGRWALREACRAAAQELAGLTVSVNVSPLQLRGDTFVGQVRDALREFHLDPARLELEITESVFIEDAHGALRQLNALRGLGVRVALDDFGTGYSSLSYLRRFQFDTLKIDRAFINEMLQQGDARAIVHMIANLATSLGMRTVCEGVETKAQLAAVNAAGCDHIQGYLVSAPRPLPEFVRLARDWRSVPHRVMESTA